MKDLWFFETKIGMMGIAADDQGITDVFLGKEVSALDMRLEQTPLLSQTAEEIREYLDGRRREFGVQLHLEGTPFQMQVWDALRCIPYGEIRSYKEIAESIGNPKASRAVGMANNKNPVMILVPCHRVIGQDGSLTGYAGGVGIKRYLLDLEGHDWRQKKKRRKGSRQQKKASAMSREEMIRADVIRRTLEGMAESDLQKFTSPLIPNISPKTVLGVRLPKLRHLAAKIAKGDWRAYLAQARDDSYEEILLQGMVIGKLQIPLPEALDHIRAFLPKIDNWSTCDSFCAGLKLAKTYPEEIWGFIQPYFSSREEYQIRFAVVMLLDYYVEERYRDVALQILEDIRHDSYYVRMAVAWAVSIYYIRFPKEVLSFLEETSLDDLTYNKALQKIIESRAVDEEARSIIRRMKRKR